MKSVGPFLRKSLGSVLSYSNRQPTHPHDLYLWISRYFGTSQVPYNPRIDYKNIYSSFTDPVSIFDPLVILTMEGDKALPYLKRYINPMDVDASFARELLGYLPDGEEGVETFYYVLSLLGNDPARLNYLVKRVIEVDATEQPNYGYEKIVRLLVYAGKVMLDSSKTPYRVFSPQK